MEDLNPFGDSDPEESAPSPSPTSAVPPKPLVKKPPLLSSPGSNKPALPSVPVKPKSVSEDIVNLQNIDSPT